MGFCALAHRGLKVDFDFRPIHSNCKKIEDYLNQPDPRAEMRKNGKDKLGRGGMYVGCSSSEPLCEVVVISVGVVSALRITD